MNTMYDLNTQRREALVRVYHLLMEFYQRAQLEHATPSEHLAGRADEVAGIEPALGERALNFIPAKGK